MVPMIEFGSHKELGVQVYLVGGAVRDRLLGLPRGDRDWVVVGATPQMMIDAGYRPVGRDFPVFLHPETNEEYALARTERKQGLGYRGFVVHCAPDVSLEQDLLRRDLTINAMAEAEDGHVIDPFHGQVDLQRRVLRHVSAAFAEDPVRILRLARFAARFVEFEVAPETMALCREMVAAGEVDALVPERVWQELARGLLAPRPERMFVVLAETGALAKLMPAWWAAGVESSSAANADATVRWTERAQQVMTALGPQPTSSNFDGKQQFDAMTDRAEQPRDVAVQWALLSSILTQAEADALAQALRVPKQCQELGQTWRSLAEPLQALQTELTRPPSSEGVDAVMTVLKVADAWRRQERWHALMQLLAITLPEASASLIQSTLERALSASHNVDAQQLARQARETWALQPQGLMGDAIALAIQEARRHQVACALAAPLA